MTAAHFALKVAADEREPAATVSVTGEVDATNAETFAAAVGEIAAERAFVLDLSDLLYLDSAGFAVLHRIVSTHRVTIVLSPRSPLRRAAGLMELAHHDTVEAAAAALAAGSD